MSKEGKVSQKAKAGGNIVQVAGDSQITNHNHITNQFNLSFQAVTSTIFRLHQAVKDFFQRGRVIHELNLKLQDKAQTIEQLQKDLQIQVANLLEAQRQMKLVSDIAVNACKKAIGAGIADEGAVLLNQLIPSLNEQNKAREPYVKSSLWIFSRKDVWTKESINAVIQNHPNEVKKEEIELFYQDICRYFDWFQKSMLYAKPLRRTLEELNNSRCILHPQPYREAFKYIKSQITLRLVSIEEFDASHKMIDYLIEEL